MDDLTRVAVQSFEENNSFECLDYLELLSEKGYSLKDVIIVCKKKHSENRVKFKWNSDTLMFERLNFKYDFQTYTKNQQCRECKNNCAKNNITFWDFLELCRNGIFELIQIRLAY